MKLTVTVAALLVAVLSASACGSNGDEEGANGGQDTEAAAERATPPPPSAAPSGASESSGVLYALDGFGIRAVGLDDALYTPPNDALFLSLSPDGKHVAYLRTDTTGLTSGMVTIGTVDDTVTRDIQFVSELLDFRWSADGKTLFFTHSIKDTDGVSEISQLTTVDISTGAASTFSLPETIGLDSIVSPGGFGISPDGSELAARAEWYDGTQSMDNQGLTVVSLRTNQYRKLRQDTFNDRLYTIAWTSQGIVSLSVTCRDVSDPTSCNHSVVVVDPTSGEIRATLQAHLPDDLGAFGDIALSGDGKWLGVLFYEATLIGPASGQLENVQDDPKSLNILSVQSPQG